MCGGVSDGVHVHVFVKVHMLQATHNALIPLPLITPHPSSFTMEYLKLGKSCWNPTLPKQTLMVY